MPCASNSSRAPGSLDHTRRRASPFRSSSAKANTRSFRARRSAGLSSSKRASRSTCAKRSRIRDVPSAVSIEGRTLQQRSPGEWDRLTWKHIDHHLRLFGA
jgi:hypothetical protein